MDEIGRINQLRQQHVHDTPQIQATAGQLSTGSEKQVESVIVNGQPHKRGTGQICGKCGEEFQKMVIPSLGLEYNLPCACERKKIYEDKAKLKEDERRLCLHLLTERAQLPIDARDWTFKNFIMRPGAEKAFDYSKQYAERFPKAKRDGAGIIIHGCTGCGKSHLAAAIANAVIQQEYTVRWWTVPELYAEIRSTYHGVGNEGDILHECKNVSLLILDDLGAEKPTEWTQQTVNTVVNSRIANHRPTVITSNFDSNMLKSQKILDDRTLSRLSDEDRFLWVQDTATDYRRERHGT